LVEYGGDGTTGGFGDFTLGREFTHEVSESPVENLTSVSAKLWHADLERVGCTYTSPRSFFSSSATDGAGESERAGEKALGTTGLIKGEEGVFGVADPAAPTAFFCCLFLS
jgi:hypothetical protein